MDYPHPPPMPVAPLYVCPLENLLKVPWFRLFLVIPPLPPVLYADPIPKFHQLFLELRMEFE